MKGDESIYGKTTPLPTPLPSKSYYRSLTMTSFYLNKSFLMCIWDPNYFNSPLDAKKVFLHITFVYSK